MDLNDCMRKDTDDIRTVSLSIKVSKNVSIWMRQHNLSPTSVFHNALKTLGCPHLKKGSD